MKIKFTFVKFCFPILHAWVKHLEKSSKNIFYVFFIVVFSRKKNQHLQFGLFADIEPENLKARSTSESGPDLESIINLPSSLYPI